MSAPIVGTQMKSIQNKSPEESRAGNILSGAQTNLGELRQLGESLSKAGHYKLAKRIYQEAVKLAPNDIEIQQNLSVCIYKNPDSPPVKRFREALQILENLGLRNPVREMLKPRVRLDQFTKECGKS